MKINKYRKIIAKLLFLVILLVMPGMQGSIVCAEDGGETHKPRRAVANINRGIMADRDFGDLHLDNTSLITEYRDDESVQSTFCCDVTNTGSRTFKGMLRFGFYNKWGTLMIVMTGYFGDNLPPGEKRTITISTSMDMTDAHTISVEKQSTENKNINTYAVFNDTLEMYDIILLPFSVADIPESWEMRFFMKALPGRESQISDIFQLHIFFRNELGDIEDSVIMDMEKAKLSEAYYHTVFSSGADLSNICSIEFSAVFFDHIYEEPTATPDSTKEPMPTSVATSVQTEFPAGVYTPEPSTGQEVMVTVSPAPSGVTSSPLPSSPPTPSPTLPVTAKPSGTPIPTAQPQAPTPTRLPGITDMPTASPTARPTQTPVVSKPGKTKLMRPVIRIKIRKIDNKMWMAEIRLKKYQGTDIQIYYRRGKGKFKKIKLRRHNIKKNKKIFKVGYKKGRKIIYLRVRTYQQKGGERQYSKYTKIKKIT